MFTQPNYLEKLKKGPESHWASLGIIALIICVGYFKVFFGGDFFIHEDFLAISNYSYKNSIGNGWRPDKGFGIPAFFGEGVWHPWSLLSLWERIAPSRVFAYNSSVMFLGFLAAAAQYFFIRVILPKSNRWTAILLAPVVVFCADQAGYHYLRAQITLLFSISMFFLLLYKYYISPRRLHLFLGAFLFWLVAAFGNLWSITQTIWAGVVFTILYGIYYRVNFKELLKKYVVLHVAAGVGFVLLSSWLLYSFFLEQYTVGYMREKSFHLPEFLLQVNVKGMLTYAMALIQSEWFRFHHNLVGIAYRPFLYSFNVSPVFPLMFIYFLFNKAESFWEYALKWVLIVFLVHSGLKIIVPTYASTFSFFSHMASKLFTMYDFIFPLQVTMIALFLSKVTKGTHVLKNKAGRFLQIGVAAFVTIIYIGLLKVSLFALSAPEYLPGLVSKIVLNFAPEKVGPYSRELLNEVLVYNTRRLQDVMTVSSVIFYITSIVLILIVVNNEWLKKVSQRSILIVCSLILVNNVFMSWSIFPLNEEQLFWADKENEEIRFESTDRFYLVFDDSQKAEKTVKSFRDNWTNIEGGGRRDRHLIGFLEPPGLSISALKSFATITEGEYMYHAFNGDGVKRIRHLRLYYGGPLISSELLDVGAVKYYYSEREIPQVPEYLELYTKAKQLYVYRNKNAWPYYYLAQRLDKAPERGHLSNVKRGTAYLSEEDLFDLQADKKASIKLVDFQFGKMTFHYTGDEGALLVIADAWHPFWKAKAKGTSLPVLRTNEIFKGVRLPQGDYDVTVVFDTSPYKLGIYVAVLSWILFIIGFWYAFKQRGTPLFKSS